MGLTRLWFRSLTWWKEWVFEEQIEDDKSCFLKMTNAAAGNDDGHYYDCLVVVVATVSSHQFHWGEEVDDDDGLLVEQQQQLLLPLFSWHALIPKKMQHQEEPVLQVLLLPTQERFWALSFSSWSEASPWINDARNLWVSLLHHNLVVAAAAQGKKKKKKKQQLQVCTDVSGEESPKSLLADVAPPLLWNLLLLQSAGCFSRL